jgi:hypothetical protein
MDAGRVHLPLLAMFAFLLAFGAVASAAQFTDISASSLNVPGCIGAAWGDYDGDGHPDLVLTGVASGHWPMLLHNDGDLAFSDVSAQMGFPATADEQDGVAWADYDNDGDPDLIIACGSGHPKLYRNDGSEFTDVSAEAGIDVAAGPGRGVAWCDYDADGWLDVFICNTMSNTSHLLHNDGNGTFTDVTTAAGMTGLAAPTAGNAAAWADFDNDAKPDLILSRMGARPLLYHNNGDGTFTEAGLAAGLAVASDTFGVAWGDYDNDGYLDCYLASATGIRDWLLHNNGDGTFTDVAATAGMAADTRVGVGVAWADFDSDGWLDLYVGNIDTGNQPFLYHNNGNGVFSEVAGSAGLGGSRPNEAAAWADLDLDGKADLFSGVGGPLSSLFHNNGPAGNWLRVRALTSGIGDATAAGLPVRDAIEARVDLNLDNDRSFPTSGHRTLTRLIDGGAGFCGQNEQIAQFGLGTATLVAVRVRFADGSVVIHSGVPANQQITIKDVPADYVEIFDDVPLDYWAYPQVKAVKDANIVAGFPDGTYRPALPVSRDQMAVYISRGLVAPSGDAAIPDPEPPPTFPDVPTDHWAYKWIEYAASQSVVQGYWDGYHPDEAVNRAQMAVFVARAMVAPSGDAAIPDPEPPPSFPDVPSDFWAYKWIEYCHGEGVVQGYWDGYHPEEVVNRAQMAVYVQRAFHLPM